MNWTRDDTYKRFGPIQTEARDLVLMGLINKLRLEQGQPIITDQEFRNLLMNDTEHLPLYDWMATPGP